MKISNTKKLFFLFLIIIAVIILIICCFNNFSPRHTYVLEEIPGNREPSSFNNQFTSYQGVQKGANIKALIKKIISNNNKYQDTIGRKVSIDYTIYDIQSNSIVTNIISLNADATLDEVNNFSQEANKLFRKIYSENKYSASFKIDEETAFVSTAIIIQIMDD